MMAAIYLCIGPEEFVGRTQQLTLHHEARRHGIRGVRMFADHGSTRQRPGFHRLQRAVLRGEVALVLVWRLDQLARSNDHLIRLIAQWRAHHVRLISMQEPFDSASWIGQALVHWYKARLRADRARRREQIRARWAAAQARKSRGSA